MTPGLVIWGASGHARVVADIVRVVGQFEIIGFLDDVAQDRWGQGFCGATILGGREQLQALTELGVRHLIFGFGNCKQRLSLAPSATSQGFELAKAIHPTAVIAGDASVGCGTVVCAGAVVGFGAKIGENVILNTCSSVDHDCIIEDGVHISPGAHLGGHVTVRRGAWIGVGASLVDRVTIGEGAIVGAGTVVLDDIPDGVVAYGVPAQVIRSVCEDDY